MWNLVPAAMLLRMAFIAFGVWLDGRKEGLQYTDIDYYVFSDAAGLAGNGFSPYERATYRYPPLLALLLVPNKYFASFGKVIFSVADAAIVYELRILLDLVDPIHTNLYCWLWVFNIASINICTRGSSDSITNYLVLLSLRLVLSVELKKNILPLVGAVVGWLIYLRVYPVIYLPAYVFYIACNYMKVPATTGESSKFRSWLNILWNTFLLMGTTILTLLALMYISYYYYGHEYLENAVLYHLSREDHRHNFSMHFYGIYLSKTTTMSYAEQLVNQLTQLLPSAVRNACSSIAESNNEVVHMVLTYLPSMVLFLPQVILFVAIIVTFAPTNLPLCLFLQTMVFVSYNKVITAQYFSWYMCLLPVCMHSLRCIPLYTLLSVSALWCLALGFWLYHAYLLEFVGLNHFYAVWVASVLFHIANTVVIGTIMWYAPK